jgi:hypothetical protein
MYQGRCVSVYDHLRMSKEQSWQISSLDQIGVVFIKVRILAGSDE